MTTGFHLLFNLFNKIMARLIVLNPSIILGGKLMRFIRKMISRSDNEISRYSTKISKTNKQDLVTFKLDKKKQTISGDVLNLLWFADTKNKNYPQQNETAAAKSENKSKNLTNIFEPSVLMSTLPIRKGRADALGYYPSYTNMSPEQRYVYFKWLINIDQEPEDVGYAFTFYYGLERWLFTEKYEDALKMIVRLKQSIHNASFQDYSNSALVVATIHHSNPLALHYINFDYLNAGTFLLLKYMFNLQIDISDLIHIRKGVGFSNNRYIKNEPLLFKKILSNKLIEKYEEPYYKIEVPHDYAYEKMKLVPLANYSLSNREIEIKNILSYTPLKEDLFNLLQDTHEEVKAYLKEKRKKE